jgi:hypothetical protein
MVNLINFYQNIIIYFIIWQTIILHAKLNNVKIFRNLLNYGVIHLSSTNEYILNRYKITTYCFFACSLDSLSFAPTSHLEITSPNSGSVISGCLALADAETNKLNIM